MKKIKGNQKGFTLIELILIIVIIGILAAVAIPKYFDLTQEAADGTLKSILGALRSQNYLMFVERTVKGESGEYTMLEIVNEIGQLSGVEYELEDKMTLRVTVGGNYNYTLQLDQPSKPPTVLGKIIYLKNPDW